MVKIKHITGYGVVGTWVSPHKLGGSLPRWLEDKENSALLEAEDNSRLLQFKDETEQWLCEITIKPIRKVEAVTKTIFDYFPPS